MKRTGKILATVMALLMIFTAIPMTAFAEAIPVAKLGETYEVTVSGEDTLLCSFIPEESGIYVVTSDNGEFTYESDPCVVIYEADTFDTVADSDDGFGMGYNFCCIFEAEAGKEYYIELSTWTYDEYITYDFGIYKYAEIDHQPTAAEKYVTLTEDVEADYDWYSISTELKIVDDKRAEGRSGEDGFATFRYPKGWKGIYNGYTTEDGNYDEYNFFAIYLLAGQTVEMTADCYASYFGIWSHTSYDSMEWEDKEANTTFTFTATESAEYLVYGAFATQPYVQAKASGLKLLEDQNSATLDTNYNGEYICKVNYKDGRTEYSDTFEITDGVDYVCGHMCHKDGILGFLWDIINFFSKLFGLNPICECGEVHY